MKNYTNIMVLVVVAVMGILLSGCNSGGGRVKVLPIGENFALLDAELDPTGVNINDKNTTELLTVVREDQLQETVVELTKGDKPVIKTPEDVSKVTGTNALMGSAFGPRPKVVRASK